ncbi:PrgI family protein [Saccharothrix longispora]|uniref:PrgI family protein n=1 Tax=Saccharothrix longispora TaxID=33920 RepID=UPI0028FD5F9A|nr:PrgI family protein [Saccharothrix longispora]MBY8850786.1 PrgI family protein [Saccharothrix sp. MB29]MDU0293509.1 PrgI family protein [Saccharothrix longispora]
MTAPVRIPADVDMHDRVLGPLTARQLAILAAAATALYLIWLATRAVVPMPVFGVFAVPVGAASVMLALGTRDGMPMDRLLLAAVRQRLAPRHHVAAPEGVRPAPAWLVANTKHTAGERRRGGGAGRPEQVSPSALRLPAEAVTETGVVDLGCDGLAVVAVASTVNFALRTPNEQEALVASFGRYLHSLTAPVQVLVRTERLDLSARIAELRERSGGLPHPALEAAAVEHADYLLGLAHQSELLRRQVLLVLREPFGVAAATDGLGGPGPLTVLGSIAGRRRAQAGGQVDAGTRRAAESRLARRLGEAIELLSPAGIVVTPLDAGQATAVLASACNPDSLLPASAGLAGAEEVITTASGADPTDDDHDGSRFAYAGTTSGGTSARGPDGDGDDYGDGDGDGDEDEDDRDYDDYEDERGQS